MERKQLLLILIASSLLAGGWVGGRAWWEKQSCRARLQEQAVWLARWVPDEVISDRNADAISFLEKVTPEEWTEAGLRREDLYWFGPTPAMGLPDVVLLSAVSVDHRRMAVMRNRSVRWLDFSKTAR